ncbi:Zinc finger CCCH domain-containing protein 44 [Triticum urartu]|uniref:Zinc finger CCCH domain-containing protein 44 n=1 Tax=Triticum urartu TaxID=4572 RepID=M7ZHD3_TRIUA|nr:Zinc finger CCCH domain-containing protein 44 [Triticum urartu]
MRRKKRGDSKWTRNCLKSYHPCCVGKEDDFIDSSEQYVCDWHKCAKCGSDALYLCLCCPSSSTCGDCFGKIDFIPVKQSNEFSMGFCRSCFNMAVATEKDDREEAKVAFGGTPENYEILFKDYWSVLNDKERFTLLDLQIASIRHKRSLQCKEGNDSNEYHKTDGKPLGDNDGAGPSSLLDTMDKPNEVQATLKRKKLEKKTYVGWASKELTEFLSCIGKDTSTPLDHFKVAEVVREYVRQKNLHLHDKKKKSVMCDENLHSLFNKKKIKYNMIHSLVEMHLSANAISEDESDGSVDDTGYTVKKKPRNSLEPKIPKSVSGIDPIIPKSVSGTNKNCLAALNPNNLNLIYLRRTLVVKLLTELDTFEQKVIGCLVRVKNDLKSYTYMMTKKYYQIGLVTGIKKSSEEYKIKNTFTDVLLCVSGMWDDVKISMLSEEDFEEDECNDLLKSAKKELFKRPTVSTPFGYKINVILGRLILYPFLVSFSLLFYFSLLKHSCASLNAQKMLLSTPEERQRRLEATPEVIPDAEGESKETGIESAVNIPFQGNRGERQQRLEVIPEVIPDAEEGSKETEIESAARSPFQGSRGVIQTVADPLEVGIDESLEGVIQTVADPLEVGIDESLEGASLRHDAACEVVFEAAGKALCNGGTPGPGLHTQLNKAAGKALCNGGTPGPGLHTQLNTAAGKTLCNGGTPVPGLHTPLNEVTAVTGVIDIDNEDDGNGPSHHTGGDKEYVIDLVSDDDEDVHMEQREPERAKCDGPVAVNGIAAHAHDGPEAVNGVTVPTVHASNGLDGNTGPACSTSQAMVRDPVTVNGTGKSDQGWMYIDPQGREHGPYPMAQMREWQQSGYFPEGFRVWRAGRSRRGRASMLLIDAMRLH